MINYNYLNKNLLLVSHNGTIISIYFEYDSANVIYKEFMANIFCIPNTFFKNEKNMNSHEMFYAYLIKKFLNLYNMKIIINVLKISKQMSSFILAIYGIAYILSRKIQCISFNPLTKKETGEFENNIFCIVEDGLILTIYYTNIEIDLYQFLNYLSANVQFNNDVIEVERVHNIKKRRISQLKFDYIDSSTVIASNKYVGLYINKTRNYNNILDFSQSSILNKNVGMKSYINLHYAYDDIDIVESRRIQNMIIFKDHYRITLNVLNSYNDHTVYSILTLSNLLKENIFVFAASLNISKSGVCFFSYLTKEEKKNFNYEVVFVGKNKMFSYFEFISTKKGVSLNLFKNILNISYNKKINSEIKSEKSKFYKEIDLKSINLSEILSLLKTQNVINFIILETLLRLESDNLSELNKFIFLHIKQIFDAKVIQEVSDGFLVEFFNKKERAIIDFEKDIYVGQKIKIIRIGDNQYKLYRDKIKHY